MQIVEKDRLFFWDVCLRVDDPHVAGAPFELIGRVVATNPEAAKNEALDARHPNGLQRMRDGGAFVVSVFCRGEVDCPIFLGWIH